MEITWEVEDGYVGKDRPQHTTIPDEEFEDCETEEQKQEIINAWIQDEFDQTITWAITNVE